MELIGIIALVFLLYGRVWNAKYLIDDNVRRWEYLYIVPEVSPTPLFYSTQAPVWRNLFPVITHAGNVCIIYVLWGWLPALLFAVNPLSANGAAWITGGYYSATTFLALVGFFFLTKYSIIGAIIGSFFFTAALGSTITCIGFPLFLFIFYPWAAIWMWPLLTYVFGKRFRKGFGIRNVGKKDAITPRKIAVMTKVMAYYIKLALFPNKLSFFRDFGFEYTRDEGAKGKMDSFNMDFWVAFSWCVAFLGIGWQFSPLGTMWFFVLLLPFSQFKILGQFVAERYLYLPNIGLMLILSNALAGHPAIIAVVATAYAYRTHLYVPAWMSIEAMYQNGIKNYPKCISNFANLGERCLHTGDLIHCYRLLLEGLKIDKDSFLCHCNLAAYWISVHNYGRALYHTKRGLAYKGQQGLAQRILGGQEKNVRELLTKLLAMRDRDEVFVEIPMPTPAEEVRNVEMGKFC